MRCGRVKPCRAPKKRFASPLSLPWVPSEFAATASQKSAVLQDFDGIARDGCAECQAGERRHQLIDWRTTFNVQFGITVTSNRPDDNR